MADFQLIQVVIGLPLLAAVILGLFGSWLTQTLGKRVVGALAVLPLVGAFGLTAKIVTDLLARKEWDRSVVVYGSDWIASNQLRMPFEWLIDPLSMTMSLIVTGIGSLIFLYSTGYMKEERDYSRFFACLNLFATAMLVLVLGNNLGLLFMGWEGVGLCSYLLIGFWYKDLNTSKAANKAFIVNRIGDWGLTLAFFLMFAVITKAGYENNQGRTFSYEHLTLALETVLTKDPTMATAIGLLLFIGAAGKSAQFPLYLWLPDAMAGPTPVSALIHAATMVTSGVVLLNRLHIVFELSPVASAVVAGVGAFTALYAALVAFGQTDIKKVLAYSTVSQLGFMFIACGSGAYWAGMFHVTTHAFFKALLFLGAGAVIHAMKHDQDMRRYGKLARYLPITSATMVVGWLAISAIAIPGVFGFAGWYSKEAILGSALAGKHAVAGGINVGVISGWVGLFVALLTSVYMTRLTSLTFFGKEERWRALPAVGHDHHEDYDHHEATGVVHMDADDKSSEWLEEGIQTRVSDPSDPHGFYFAEEVAEPAEDHHGLSGDHQPKEVPASMWFPLVVLAALSLAGGYLLSQNNLFEHWLYPPESLTVLKEVSHHPEGVPLELISCAAAVLGIVFGLFAYRNGLPKNQDAEANWSRWRRIEADQFGFDRTLVNDAVNGGGQVARGLWQWFDLRVIDGFVNGLGGVAEGLGKGLRYFQSGMVRVYAFAMLIGVVGLISYFLLVSNSLGGRH